MKTKPKQVTQLSQNGESTSTVDPFWALSTGVDLRVLLEQIPVAVYVLDTACRIRAWNQAAEKLYGWRLSEVEGRLPANVPQHVFAEGTDIFRAALSGRHVYDRELTRVHKNGQLIQVSLSTGTVQDAQGNAIGVYITAVNISEQVSISSLLEGRLDFLRGVLEAIPNPVYLKSINGEYQVINRAYETQLGVNRAEVLGKKVGDVFDDESASLREIHDQKVLESKQPLMFQELVKQGEEHRRFEHHKSVFRAGDGSVEGILGVLNDTTEIHRSYERSNLLQERLKLALQASEMGFWDIDFQTGLAEIDQTVQYWLQLDCQRVKFSELPGPGNEIMDLDKVSKNFRDLVKGTVQTLETECVVNVEKSTFQVFRIRGRVTAWSASGRALRATGTIIDVTKSKAKEQVERMREQQLNLISENIEDLLLMCDRNGVIVFHSKSVLKWLARSDSQSVDELSKLCSPDDIARLSATLAGINGDKPESSLRVKFTTADYSQRFVDLSIKLIRGDYGHSSDWILVVGRDVHDRIELDEQLERLAHFDHLTGVANRNLLRDRAELAINRARRFKGMVGVVFIDLDDFKRINDSYGHAAGDELLKTVAQRLKGVLRNTDTVARQGGDEFILLLDDLQSEEQAQAVVERVLSRFETSFDLNVALADIRASIGVALYPNDGNTVEELFASADSAMYEAKASGKGRLAFFTDSMRVASQRRAAIESGLIAALAEKQFTLVYQPQIDLYSGELIGAEALLRWTHPVLGPLGPLEFVPIAEASGLIIPIGNWVLEEGCRQVSHWSKRAGRPLRLAINVSARQWTSSDMALNVAQVLGQTELAPSQLELELTESVMMNDLNASMVTMRWLKSMGVTFALDDFGTGYSSLSYLKRFEIDLLKIDRSFTQDLPGDLHDTAIVKAILAMAKGLGVKVLAEGIETAEQLDFLRAHNCDFGQGYYIAKPLTVNDFEKRFLAAAEANVISSVQIDESLVSTDR